MEVGQGPNWGCSAKGEKMVNDRKVVMTYLVGSGDCAVLMELFFQRNLRNSQ
jgi:hypothetical protein